MQEATAYDLERFASMRESGCPDGHFLGDGIKVVRRMLARNAAVRVLITPEWLEKISLPDGVEVRTATRPRLEEITGYRLHQGIMALGRIPATGPVQGSLLLALDGVVDAENVGAILRASAAFGVDGVIVGPGTASPWLRRAVRVSIAAPLHVPCHFVRDLAETLRPLNAWAAHIHGDRQDYRAVDLTKDCCLVLGGEADGVSDAALGACRGRVMIPMAGGWDCLNVASSAAVLLSEVRRQRDRGGAPFDSPPRPEPRRRAARSG